MNFVATLMKLAQLRRVQKGKRYVASFQIACGDCFFCKRKLSSQCEKTNSNTTERAMYGGRSAGMFGYSQFMGGFAGGQAEYVRVPLGDVNLSDVLPASYNAVHDTAVYPGDKVAIFGAGPIGQMPGIFGTKTGATKIIFVDTEPRLTIIRNHWPAGHTDKLELIDYRKLSFGVTNRPAIVSKLKELCSGRDLDAAIECAALDPLQIVSHCVRMEDLDKVYYRFENREDSMQEVFAETKFSLAACQGCLKRMNY
ncbi:hypothetical protein AAE478_007264 [Parahypoxylon ruwenzoriense]